MFCKKLFFALCFIVLFTRAHSQLSGSYSVPGTFTSLASAITSLNIGGVAGPVTINIQAGYTETAVAGGYSLYTVVGSSSVNTVMFKKNGAGSNPVIFAYTGVNTPTSTVHDGVWRLIGADYVTIDGINITDNNNSAPATMEFGFGFFKANTFNGCQFNTITNCVVTLKRGNNDPGATNGLPGSCAVELANALASAHNTQLIPASVDGSNSNNRFYNNLIQNCNSGFGLNCALSGSITTFADYNNDIGGTSAVTGNTVINYGGGSNTAANAVAIYTRGQQNINISYNQINNNNGSGVSCLSPLYGILSDIAPSANLSITNNTISLKAGISCYSGQAIYNDAGSGGLTNTLNISNNLIANCTNTLAYYSTFYGVITNASARNVLIAGNTFTNNSVSVYNASAALIANNGLVSGNLSVQNNLLSNQYTLSGANNSVSLVYVASSALANVSCNSNTFTSVSLTGTVPVEYVKISNSNTKLSLNNNRWLNINMAFNGQVKLIANYSQSDSVFTLYNNVVNNYTNTGAANGFTCYLGSNNTHPNCVSTYSGNIFSGITSTVTGTGSFYGIQCSEGYAPGYTRKLIFSNTVSNIAYNSDLVYGIYADRLGEGAFNLPSSIYNNTITAISGRSDVYGIGTNTITSFHYPPLVYSNIITGISGTGTSGRSYGASLASGDGGIRFYRNKITNIAHQGGAASGIEIYTGTDIRVFNNLIGAITSTAIANDAVAGIHLPYSSSEGKIYNNSIYLSGQAYGSSCIYNEYGKAEIRNNILINNCTPTGSGLAAALNDPHTYSISVYSSLSDNNIFYAGTSGPNNALAIVGSVTCTSLAQMKASLGGRELNSMSENVAFNSTVTSAGNYLTINTASATAAESGAVAIPWITDDYSGAARSGSLTDIGAYEGSYTPSATDLQAPAVLSYGFNNLPCNSSGRSFTVSMADLGGVAGGTLSPRLYYTINSGTYTSATGSLVSGTPNLGSWLFNLAYTASVGDVVSWYLLSQDGAGNIASLPSSQSFTAASVNSVTAVPLVNTYSVQINLGGTYTVGTAGTFSTLTDAANAYNRACLTGPVTFVLTNTLYAAPTETFPVLFKNNPYASQTNSLLIIPASGMNVLISASPSSLERAAIKMAGARFITMDGTGGGGSGITINVAPGYSFCAGVWLTSDNKSLSFNRVNLTGSGFMNYNSYGMITAAESFTDYSIYNSLQPGDHNDSIAVNSCTLSNLGYGIYANYSSTTSPSGSWNISNNYLGAAATGSNYLRYSGIVFSGVMSTVASNTVSGVVNTATTITDPQNGAYNYIFGITVSGTKNIISKNSIRNLSTNQEATGMTITGGDHISDVEVSNNMIVDINRNYFLYNAHVTCFAMSGTRLKVNHNTFALTQGTYVIGGPLISAPIIFPRAVQVDGGTDNTFNNNIVYNDIYRTAGGVINHGIFMNTNVNPFSQINYNNYYLPGPDGYLGYFNGSQVMSFSSFTSIVGGNQSSTLLPVVFTASNDAHLDPASLVNYPLQSSGTPIAGISTDIDNQARSLTAPTIGADEFASLAPCNSASVSSFAPATRSLCATDPIVLTGQGASAGNGLSLQWEEAASPAGTFTSVGSGNGYTSANFSPGALPAGVYYYKLRATCASASLTGSSNVLTVTVINPPALTVTPASYSVCTGQAVSFTASGAASYTWSTGSTSSVVTATPAAGSSFYVSYSNPACPVQVSGAFPVYLNITPTISASSPSGTICNGVTTSISASGASTYSWSNGATGSTITPNPTVTTVYSVTGTNGTCASGTSYTITVKAAPTLSISGPSTICSGQSITLVASGASSYTWNASVFSASLTTTPATSTVYNVTGLNSQGCSASQAYPLQVNTSTAVSISGPSLACQGQSVTLIASGAGTYSWSTGANTNSITVGPAAFTSYTVTGGPSGCTSSAVASVSVSPLPTLSINGSSAVCQGQSVSLTASGAFTYTWNSGATGAGFSDIPAAATNYSVTGTTSSGCTGNASVSVSVNPVPTLTISSSAATVCPGSAVTFTASGAGTYTWSTAASAPVITVTPFIASVYTVTGSSAQGCSSSQTVAVSTHSVAAIVISPPSATLCAQSSISFTASGAITYTWSNGAGNLASAGYTPLVNSVYTVTGTNAGNGCISSKTVGVTSNSLPVVGISGPSSVCIGQSATLIAAGAASYVWNTSATAPSISVSPVSNTTYFVAGTSSAGCSSSASFAVTSNSLPAVSITPASASICASSTLVLTGSGATSYTWSTGATGSAITATPSTATIYSVSGSNAAGCISGATVGVATNSLPVISISPSLATVCMLSPVGFTASGAASFTWSGGAGNLPAASYTPAGSSVYTVSGTSLLNGCISSKTVNVLVNSLPSLSITGNATICAGLATTLTPFGANSYTWSNAPGTGSIVVSPAASTVYSLGGTSTAGCTSFTSIAVTTSSLPVILLAQSATVACQFSPITFTASGAVSYTWSAGGNANPITINPSAPAIYTVNGSNNAGCTSSATVAVATNPLPAIVISPAAATVCAQSPLSFSATGAATYSWSDGGGSLAQAGYTPAISTVYSVSGSDAVSGCVAGKTVQVTVLALPQLSISGQTLICSGQPTNLSATGAVSYSWAGGQPTASVTESPLTTTSYSVTGTGSNSCQAQASIQVSVIALPTVVVNSGAICAGQVFTISASGATSYTYSGGSNTVSPSSTTSYSVTGTGPNGCVSLAGAVSNVTVNPDPIITVSGSLALICVGESATLTAGGASTYTWNTSESGPAIVINPTVTTTYTVWGSNVNGCAASTVITQGVDNCTSVKNIGLTAAGFLRVYPNPNSGEFIVEAPTKGTIIIYNVIGEKVHESAVESDSQVFSLAGMANGVYFVHLRSENKMEVVRIIKN